MITKDKVTEKDMSLDCAKKYAEGKINDILNQAIIDAYSAGYNVGYQDGYKKAEKETILEEMKYVDLGLPSGTLWASDYIKKDGEVLFLPYRDAIDEFNLPTNEQIDELKDYCEISLVEDNGIKTYICLGPSGKTFHLRHMDTKHHQRIMTWIMLIFGQMIMIN